MSEITAIEKIREVVLNYDEKLLDQKVIERDVSANLALGIFVDLYGNFETNYEDINIKDIMFLSRSDGWEHDVMSWRELINTWIYGDTWSHNVFEYFEGQIQDKLFPAEGAGHILKIESYGGVLGCANGNHRLVGACCWMACKNGDNAKLQSVYTSTFKLKDATKTLLQRIDIDKEDIYVYESEFSPFKNNGQFIKIETNENIQFFQILDKDTLQKIDIVKFYSTPFKFINDYLFEKELTKKNLNELYNQDWSYVKKEYLQIWKRMISL